jgi:hypothetical protein
MKIFISPYQLSPLKRANRLSSLQTCFGVYVKGVLKDKILFADYFPHISLGDRPLEEFLESFKYQNHEYDQKVFHLLLKDADYQKPQEKLFYNHQLWTESEEVSAPVIKYKLLHSQDRVFLPLLDKGIRLRLDANGAFNREDLKHFFKGIPREYLGLIEYLEDPLTEVDWKDLVVPGARDFIQGSPFEFYIYKPNCEFKPKTDAKIIFSSYLGSNLGRWHATAEMLNEADLKLVHGVVTQGFYQEEKPFLTGSYGEGFKPDPALIKKIYLDVAEKDWTFLCSM